MTSTVPPSTATSQQNQQQQQQQQKVDPLGVSVVAQLYDVEEGNIITAMDSYLNYVFLGYESGMLQRLEIHFDEEDATNIYTAVSHTDFGTQPRRKHRIKQLIHSNVEPFLIVLCHQQLTILASETFQVLKQVATDVGCCSLSLATPMSLQATWNNNNNNHNSNNNNNNPINNNGSFTSNPSTSSSSSASNTVKGRTQTILHSHQQQGSSTTTNSSNAAAATATGGSLGPLPSSAPSFLQKAYSTLIHRICSSEKEARGLSVHEFCFSAMSLRENVDNFVFPERVRFVAEANGFLYVGLSREYSVLSMESGDVRRLVPLNGCTPQIAICDPNYGYFLLESVIFSVGVDKMPQSSNAAVISFENSVTPNCFTVRPGTLFSFTDRHCVVYSTLLQRQLQKLAIPECQFVSHKSCECLLPPPYGGTVVRSLDNNNNNNADSDGGSPNYSSSSVGSGNAHPLELSSAPGHAGSSNKNVYDPLTEVPAPLVFVASKTRLHMLRMFPIEKQLRELIVKRFRIDCAEDLLRSCNVSPVLAAATERLERLTKVMAGFSRLRRGLVEEGLATFASLVDVRQILRLTPSLVCGSEKSTIARPSFLAAIANCPERCAEVFLFRLKQREEKKKSKKINTKENLTSTEESSFTTTASATEIDDNNNTNNPSSPTMKLPVCPHYSSQGESCSRCPHTPTLQFVLNMIFETSSGEDAVASDKRFWAEWSMPAIVQPSSNMNNNNNTSSNNINSTNLAIFQQPFMYDPRVDNLDLEWEARIDFEKIRALQLEQLQQQRLASQQQQQQQQPGVPRKKAQMSGAHLGGSHLHNKNEFLRHEINNLWSRLRLSLQGYLSIFVDDSLRGQQHELATTAEGARRAAEYALLVLHLLGGVDQARHETILAAVRGDISCAKPEKKSKSAAPGAAITSPSSSSLLLDGASATPSIYSINNNIPPFQQLQYKNLRRVAGVETYPIVSLLKNSQILPIRDCVALFGATEEWRLMLLLARTRDRLPAESSGGTLRWKKENDDGGDDDPLKNVIVETDTSSMIPNQPLVAKIQADLRVNPAREFFTKHLSVWRLLQQSGARCPKNLQEWCRETLQIDQLPRKILHENSKNNNTNQNGDKIVIVDDAHSAFIALEHLNVTELQSLHKSDPTVLRRLRDSDGLTVLHHLVFLLAHVHVEERIDLMLMVENSNELEIRKSSSNNNNNNHNDNTNENDQNQEQQQPKLKNITQYGAGTKLSGPTKDDRMLVIRRLVRFFVEECDVPVNVRAPCLLDQENNLLCFTPAEFALVLSYSENGNNSLRFVHSLDSSIIIGALCAANFPGI